MPSERLRLGNYEPLLQLATGGMAQVFVARQIGAAGFERLVVVKRVHRHLVANHDFSDMLRDEARVASLIRHPNVAPVIDVVEAEGELFLVMEYIESTALSTLLKATSDARARVPPAIAARIAIDTLHGLHAAHEVTDMRGNRLDVVHRDVSPQNIVVGVDGTSRLVDFGVAKARHRITETKSGSLKGKYGYMSPEQARAQGLDPRSDVFSLAIVFHETLTGKRLFQGEHELDTLRRIVEWAVPPPSALAAGIPPALDATVLRALERAKDARFQSAAEMADAIEAAIAPASAREVAAFLQERCGERLRKRRETLAGMLEGRIEPLDADPAGTSGERLTLPSSPSAIVRREAARAAAEASVHGASISMRPQPRRWTLAATAAMLVAVGVGIGLVVSRGDGANANAVASSIALRVATGAEAFMESAAPASAAPPVASVTPPAPAPASPPAASSTSSARRKPGSATAAPRPNELQSNPYGQP